MTGIVTAIGLALSAVALAADWWLTMRLRQTERAPRETRLYVIALLFITGCFVAILGIVVHSPDRYTALVAFEPGLGALIVTPSIVSRLWRSNHRR